MERKPVKVCPKVIDLKTPDIYQDDSILSTGTGNYLILNNNESTISPSKQVLKSLHDSIDITPLNHAPDFKARKLRRALSHHTGNSFNSISCFGNKAATLDSVTRTYLQQGLDALITWPNEGLASHYMNAAGARVINAQFKDPFKPRVEELIDSISQNTRMIYIANPNPITGAVLSEAELVFLLSYASKIMVVVEESFYEYSNLATTSLVEDYSNLLLIRTFSMAFALGSFDISYIITDPQNLKFINRLAIGKSPDLLAQTAAIAALTDEQYLKKAVYKINESKKMLYNFLTVQGYEFTISPANFITIKVTNPEAMIEMFQHNNIYVKDLKEYPGLEKYLRITIGSPEQTEILIKAINQANTENTVTESDTTNRIKHQGNAFKDKQLT